MHHWDGYKAYIQDVGTFVSKKTAIVGNTVTGLLKTPDLVQVKGSKNFSDEQVSFWGDSTQESDWN
jgi:hypothetical protein